LIAPIFLEINIEKVSLEDPNRKGVIPVTVSPAGRLEISTSRAAEKVNRHFSQGFVMKRCKRMRMQGLRPKTREPGLTQSVRQPEAKLQEFAGESEVGVRVKTAPTPNFCSA
jgi:hypothetical protein